MGMLKTIEEIKNVEIEAGVLVNGVDNANLMSVDSTEPISKAPDNEKVSEGDIDEEISEVKKEEKIEEKKTEEKKEEEIESELIDENDSKPVKKRIGELTKRWRTAERERDFERERIQELEAKLEELSSKIPDEDKPQKEDFDDEDDYIEALTDWKIESKLKASQKKSVEKIKDKEERQAVTETYVGLDDAIESGNKKYKDFSDIVLDENLIISPQVAQILLDTDIPEDIMYFLGSNPEESERISGLDPIRAAKEIGKIEVKLEKEIKKEEKKEKVEIKPVVKKQSSAPEPITPVRTDGVTEKDPNKMSPAEYRAWRLKK